MFKNLITSFLLDIFYPCFIYENVENLLSTNYRSGVCCVGLEVSKERHDNHNYGHNFLGFRQNGKTFLLLHLPAQESLLQGH